MSALADAIRRELDGTAELLVKLYPETRWDLLEGMLERGMISPELAMALADLICPRCAGPLGNCDCYNRDTLPLPCIAPAEPKPRCGSPRCAGEDTMDKGPDGRWRCWRCG